MHIARHCRRCGDLPCLLYVVVSLQSHIIINLMDADGVQCPEVAPCLAGQELTTTRKKMSLIPMKTNFSSPRPVNERDPPIHNFGAHQKLSHSSMSKKCSTQEFQVRQNWIVSCLQRQFDYSRKLTSQKTLSEEMNGKVINEIASGKAMISPRRKHRK